MRFQRCLVLALGTLLCGCVSLSPLYRNTSGNLKNSIRQHDGYALAFIEFGEQGSYQDPSQIENAVDLIKQTSKPLVITYVHGWHNSAGSDDVTRFSSWLADLSKTPMIASRGFHIIGVYLGWRGEITKVPVVRQFTFYNRKTAAERLASNYDCFDAIAAVSQAAREFHQNERQYTVLIGHSFGGLVVERAVAHAINAEIHGHVASDRSFPADLILMVNPASDSILTRQMIAALYDPSTANKRPFLVSLTSSADMATGLAFHVSTSLAATTKAFDQVQVPGSDRLESEEQFYTTTPGHNEFLINYQTEKLAKTIEDHGLTAVQTNLSHNLSGEVFTTGGTNGMLELWRLKRITSVDVPYWDVKVDPSIIPNHGDIWNDRAKAMMAAIFRMTNPIMNPTAKPRANLRGMVRQKKEPVQR
jgi:pimeloyl-ACP methyl ester carboxylesterase